MRKIIFIGVILLVIFILLGVWYWQNNNYSKDVLRLEIIGPQEASLFEEVEYTIKYKNNSNFRMEEPRLIFEFPEYTLPSDYLSDGQNKTFERRQEMGFDELGDIYPGEEKVIKFKGRLFGKEGDLKTAKAWLSYKPKNLSAKYESATTFSTVIKQIPLTFDFDLSSKIEAGRDFKFSLNYYSNLEYPISNLGIRVDYPQGFEFIESVPKTLDKTEWDIPVLNKADGGRIEIRGRLAGETQEERMFRSSIGVWQDNEFVVLKEITRGIEIVEPYLDIFQRINGSDNYIADPGDLLHYEIFFRNISQEPFSNLFMVVKLDGKAFDLNSVKTDNGQVSKGDSSIVWDWRNVSQLSFLSQGSEGKVEFWVNLKDWSVNNPGERNAVLKNSVLISQTKKEFSTRLNSKLSLTQTAAYNDEAFGNTGPTPPRAGEATTYTITWQVKNYYNDVKNTTVRAVLPQNVRLTGKIFPESESSKFTFDNLSREIVWRLSDGNALEPGTGVINSAPSISFQVALTPDSSQRGKTAQIIGEARVRGEDQWTDENIESVVNALDTTLPNDPNISDHSGIVQ